VAERQPRAEHDAQRPPGGVRWQRPGSGVHGGCGDDRRSYCFSRDVLVILLDMDLPAKKYWTWIFLQLHTSRLLPSINIKWSRLKVSLPSTTRKIPRYKVTWSSFFSLDL
jgi:hypothetical protein